MGSETPNFLGKALLRSEPSRAKVKAETRRLAQDMLRQYPVTNRDIWQSVLAVLPRIEGCDAVSMADTKRIIAEIETNKFASSTPVLELLKAARIDISLNYGPFLGRVAFNYDPITCNRETKPLVKSILLSHVTSYDLGSIGTQRVPVVSESRKQRMAYSVPEGQSSPSEVFDRGMVPILRDEVVRAAYLPPFVDEMQRATNGVFNEIVPIMA